MRAALAAGGAWSPAGVLPALFKRRLYQVAPVLLMIVPILVLMVALPRLALYLLVVPLVVAMRPSDPYELAMPATPHQLLVTRVGVALLLGWTPALVWAFWAAPRAGDAMAWWPRATLVMVLFVHALAPEVMRRVTARWGDTTAGLVGVGVWGALGLVWVYVSRPLAMGAVWVLGALVLAALVREWSAPGVSPMLDVGAADGGARDAVRDEVRDEARDDARAEARDEARAAVRATVGQGITWRDAGRLYAACANRYLLWLAPLVLLMLKNDSHQLLFPLVIAPSLFFQPLTRLAWLSTLPVPIGTRVALHAALPVLLTVLMGVMQLVPVGPGELLSSGAPVTRDAAGGRVETPTRVPLTYWQPVAAGVPIAPVVAPWGETVMPDSAEVAGRRLVNVFTVRPESSARLVAWQHDRMTRAVFGRVVPRDTVASGRLPRRVTAQWPMVLLQGALVLAWLLVMAASQVTASPAWSAASLVFVLPVAGTVWELVRGSDQGAVVVPLLQRGLLDLVAALPFAWLVPVVAAVPVLAAGWVLWARVRRAQLGEHFAVWLALHGLVK